MLGNFSMELGAEKENKFGKTFLYIKDTGKMIKQMEEVD